MSVNNSPDRLSRVGMYETIIFVLLGVLLFLCGVVFGRKLERYEMYLKLLSSRDPKAWTVAHRLRKHLTPPPPEPDDSYPPTALEARLPEKTTIIQRKPPSSSGQ